MKQPIISIVFVCCFTLQSILNAHAFSFSCKTLPVTTFRGGASKVVPHVGVSHAKNGPSYQTQKQMSSSSGEAASKEIDGGVISNIYSLTGIFSAIAWVATAYVALSFHPDPKFADCTLRHNLLTMSQAFAFPLPIGWATFEALRHSAKNHNLNSKTSRRLNLGVSAASFWLAASSAFPRAFAFGYDLYSTQHKLASSMAHAATGLFAMSVALRYSSLGQIIRGLMDSMWNLGPTSDHRNSSLYATGAAGLFYFTIQPIVSKYPLATIPSILGKRLSRPASAFTLLGAAVAFCLKERTDDTSVIRATLRKGLVVGTSAHLCLIFMKIIGVDGGGLIFPGRGLWEVYPAMVNVPFAAGVSFATHAILLFGALNDEVDDAGGDK